MLTLTLTLKLTRFLQNEYFLDSRACKPSPLINLTLENIVVDGWGSVKIIDVGFSYRVGEVAK